MQRIRKTKPISRIYTAIDHFYFNAYILFYATVNYSQMSNDFFYHIILKLLHTNYFLRKFILLLIFADGKHLRNKEEYARRTLVKLNEYKLNGIIFKCF